jgi:hypothetical protein
LDALAIEQNIATGRSKSTADQIEQRGFACTIGANHRNPLTRLNRQINATDDFGFAKALANIFQF